MIPYNLKREAIEFAKGYASTTYAGITNNDPKKYKAFRDGQDSGYSLASAQLEEKEKEIVELKRSVLDGLKVEAEKESQRKEWADMCIKKQAMIEEMGGVMIEILAYLNSGMSIRPESKIHNNIKDALSQ